MPTREELIIEKTHRLPAPTGPDGDGSAAARQFDVALMSVGWKLSGDLLEHLSGRSAATVVDTAVRVLPVVRREIGAHVVHNTYFLRFPADVPDTLEFWAACVADALLDPDVIARGGPSTLLASGGLNLLALPRYGRYLHTYPEMLAAHDDLVPAAGDRVTVLHLGGPLEEEAAGLYRRLAGSQVPLNESDLDALRSLAPHHATDPVAIPVRENRAVVNQVRLDLGADLLIDTVTDVLRLACALSGGDVTLEEPTRFRSFRRPVRRALLTALDALIGATPAKLGDVHAHREPWKRLGERLHAGEHPQWPHAAAVFRVARGEQTAHSFNSRVESRFRADDLAGAVAVLSSAPGLLLRSLDRLLRAAVCEQEQDAILNAAEQVIGQVSCRVVLQVREHLMNRASAVPRPRIFANRRGRAWITADTRAGLDPSGLGRLRTLLDLEVRRRLPAVGHLVIDPAVFTVALPLSGKTDATGFGVLPRGSLSPVEGELLRFFTYWKESAERTDFDLSALLLSEDFTDPTWLSFTALTQTGAEHSGDITEAPDGASEFINLDLRKIRSRVVIPQVNIYTGEGFDEVAESFFGFMLLDSAQRGAPFEPSTVRMKSDLRGPGRVALPVVFLGDGDGRWAAKWLHLHLSGDPYFNRVEGNRLTTSMLVRSVIEREYLMVRHLTDLLTAETVTLLDGGSLPDSPVTFVGLEVPEGLAEGSSVYTLKNLGDLIPA
ncbi:MAG: hypothetical protein ABIS86_22885 [Streptosporangiaceae bacterium]